MKGYGYPRDESMHKDIFMLCSVATSTLKTDWREIRLTKDSFICLFAKWQGVVVVGVTSVCAQINNHPSRLSALERNFACCCFDVDQLHRYDHDKIPYTLFWTSKTPAVHFGISEALIDKGTSRVI